MVDNILNYEVILGSGEVVNANQSTNSDLFKALKGGGTHFGIVTKVDIATFPFAGLWGGQLLMPAVDALVQQTLGAVYNFTDGNNANPSAGVQVLVAYLGDGQKIIEVGLASTDNTESPEILAPFMSIMPQIQNTVQHRTLGDFVREVSEPQPNGYR